MDTIGDAVGSVRTVLVGSIVVYVVLFLVGAVTGNATALTAAGVLFGCIALGMGGVLVRHASAQTPALAAGLALVVGGLAQFGWLVTGSTALGDTATVTVLLGVVLYVVGERYVD